jgi:hypothetical protein
MGKRLRGLALPAEVAVTTSISIGGGAEPGPSSTIQSRGSRGTPGPHRGVRWRLGCYPAVTPLLPWRSSMAPFPVSRSLGVSSKSLTVRPLAAVSPQHVGMTYRFPRPPVRKGACATSLAWQQTDGEGVLHPQSPYDLEAFVTAERFVRCHDWDVLHERLGNDLAVERISVVCRQIE